MPSVQDMPAVSPPPAPLDAPAPRSGLTVPLSREDAALVLQGLQCLIFETGLGYEDTSLKDRLDAESNEPDFGAIAEFAHDLLRYSAPVPLLRGSAPAIKAGAATLGLFDEILADILGEAEPPNTFNEADWANHERRLSGVRRIREMVASFTLTLSETEQEVMRVGIFRALQDSEPDIDRVSPALYVKGYPERIAEQTKRQAMLTALLLNVERGEIPLSDELPSILLTGREQVERELTAPDDMNPDDVPTKERELADNKALLARIAPQAGGAQ